MNYHCFKYFLLSLVMTAGAQNAFALDLYVSSTGSDTVAHDGRTIAKALRSINRAHDILNALSPAPAENVRIRIMPGNFKCSNMPLAWTFKNGYAVSIEAYEAVQSAIPSSTSTADLNRPVFLGMDGTTKCAKANWLAVTDSNTSLNLTVKNLKIEKYRNAITVLGSTNAINRNLANITISNMVFENLGDKYYHPSDAGKGAVVLTNTAGITFSQNYFKNIENELATEEGLIHAIYFTQNASKNKVLGNHFYNTSGSAIKLSHYSNNNVFLDNNFNMVQQALNDRWCGSRDTESDRNCIDNYETLQCPSWSNQFERNIMTNVTATNKVIIDPEENPNYSNITTQNKCSDHFPATSNGIRLRYGPDNKYFGPPGGALLN